MTPSYNVANFASEADYRKAHQQASHEQIDSYPDSFDTLMSSTHKRMYERAKPILFILHYNLTFLVYIRSK